MIRPKNARSFGPVSSGRCLSFLCAVMFVALAATISANASAVATSSMQLQSLVVTVSSGSLMVSPFAVVSTSAFNNLGELVSNGSSGTFPVSASVAITDADASASADPFSQTSSALAEVNFLPGASGFASASAFARTAYFPFWITGTSGPVTVTFTAVVGYDQSLLTGAVASTADSYVQASLILGNTFNVSQSSFNTIGTNSSWANSGTFNLAASRTLTAGTQYDLQVDLNDGADAQVIPEPGTLSLLLAGALTPMIRGGLRRLRR